MKDFAKSIHVGNATIKFYGETIDLTKESESYLKEILEELQMLHEGSDEQRAIKEELAKRKRTGNSKVGNLSHTKEEAKTKDEYFKILKFYQTQGYKTKAGEYNPNGRIKLHKGDDSVEIVLVGNSKVGNAKDKNGAELKVGDSVAVKTDDPRLNHGKIVRISGDQISVDVTGDDDIWTTPARLAVKLGNSKVGNESGTYNKLETEIRYAISEATVASKILSGKFSATNIISALSHCKQCCDNAIKLAQEYDREINK